jgi:hypothetical protein
LNEKRIALNIAFAIYSLSGGPMCVSTSFATRFSWDICSSLNKKLTRNETPIITVIGKAFWDVGCAAKGQSDRRKRLPQYAAWEIHPVMALHVVQ